MNNGKIINSRLNAGWARTHLGRLCKSVHRSGRVWSGSAGSWWRCALGAVPLDSNSPWRGWVYRLAPEVPLFRGMPMGLEAFLEPLGMSGPQPCVRTHQKKVLVPHSSGMTNTNLMLLRRSIFCITQLKIRWLPKFKQWIYIYIHTHTYMYTYTYIYTHTHTYIYISTHTYIHMYIHLWLKYVVGWINQTLKTQLRAIIFHSFISFLSTFSNWTVFWIFQFISKGRTR